MITVSEGFKNAMRAPVKTVGASVEVVDGDEYTSANYLTKLELTSSGHYFGVVTKSVSISLLGTDFDLVGRYVDVKLSVLVSANTWNDCILG